ncbi:MAG: hydrogen gas-evolving membrane-bound hydrogenase subunit E [Chloroflexota bacterium]
MVWGLELGLFGLLTILAVVALEQRDLIGAVAVLTVYSFLTAALLALMGAVDVSFTEVSLGAAITGVLFIGGVSLTSRWAPRGAANRLPVLALLAGFVLLWGFVTADLPDRADPHAPAAEHLSPEFIVMTEEEVHIPNVVSAVLGDFRSYDTLGETTVIFTAGMAVLLALMRGKRHDGTP